MSHSRRGPAVPLPRPHPPGELASAHLWERSARQASATDLALSLTFPFLSLSSLFARSPHVGFPRKKNENSINSGKMRTGEEEEEEEQE